MSFKIIERYPAPQDSGINGDIITAICDGAEDVTAMGTCDGCGNKYAPGSMAYVIATTPEKHMINASGDWVKVK